MDKRVKARTVLWDWAGITAGAAVYAVGFSWFYRPNEIAFGGITGVAQILNAAFPFLPVGVMVIVLNIPLFFLGWRLLGGKLLVSSLYAMAISSVFIDLLDLLWVFQPMDMMLAAVFGGALVGLSLGLVLLRGATTGGTDLLARLLKLKLRWLPMGRMLMAVDLVVIVAAAIAFGEVDAALYGLVALYISAVVMDKVLYGMDTAKVAYIISDRPAEMIRVITRDLERGATVLQGRGAWSGADKEVLMVAFKQREIVRLKAAVKGLDPAAFLIVCDAHEVLGDGFRGYSKDDI